MPSTSKKQHNFMAAVANSPKFAKKVGVPKSVGKEFMDADEGKKFRKGGSTNPMRAGINKVKTRSGMLQMPNASLTKFRGFNEGGETMKKMNPGMMAMMAKKKAAPAKKMASGGMPMVEKDGKKIPAFAADGVGKMKKGGMACGTKKMAKGGMAHSDMAKDKPMMKKVAKEEVKGHEKKMHGMARGGGIETKGKTKGTMIKMAAGGSTKKKYC